MTRGLDELAEQAKKMAEEAGGKIGALKDSEDLEQMRQVATELGEQAARFVRKYPLQSVLGAAVAGFLLGAVGRRR